MEALLFDFDGLILDTETPEVLAWEWMFAEHRLIYPREFWMNLVGRGPDQVEETPAQLLKRMGDLTESAEDLHKRFRQRYFLILKKVPRPGVELCLFDAAQKGIRMSVVSSSDAEWVNGHLADLELTNVFEQVITREFAPRSKPAPDLYLEALNRMDLTADQVWALEDSYNGLSAAKAAGIRTIVCPNPTTKHLDFSSADLIVQSLDEINLDDLG